MGRAPLILKTTEIRQENCPRKKTAEFVELVHDPKADEWSLEFSPHLDLLEIVRLLNGVQARALEMIHDQIARAQIMERK